MSHHAVHDTHIEYDEVYSYLTAAGTLDAFFDSPPLDRTLRAEDFRSMLHVNRLVPWSDIASSLQAHDIHPPLYFKMLNIWLVFTGDEHAHARLLNMLFALGTAFMLYLIAREISPGGLRALAAVCALSWLINAATLEAVTFIRQYSLLMLCGTALLHALLLVRRTTRWQHVPWLLLWCLLGVLTHYQFGVIVAAVVCYLTISWARIGAKGALTALLIGSCVTLAVAMLLWIEPFGAVVGLESVRLETDPPTLGERFRHVSTALYSVFFGPFHFIWPLLGMLALLVVFVTLRLGDAAQASIKSIMGNPIPFAYAAFATLLVTGMYAGGFSPWHAIGGRYSLMFTPLWFVVFHQMLAPIASRRIVLYGVPIIVMLYGAAGLWAVSRPNDNHHHVPLQQLLASEDDFIFDCSKTIKTMQYVWDLDPRARMVQLSQHETRTRALDEHLSGVERGFVYLHEPLPGNEEKNRLALIERIAGQGFTLDSTRMDRDRVLHYFSRSHPVVGG